MAATLHTLTSLSGFVFLMSGMLAIGMNLRPAEILEPLRDIRLVLVALGVNFVLVPTLGWLIPKLLPMEAAYADGILLLACAAGAPFLPMLVESARGDMKTGIALMVLLTFGTIVFMPFALPRLIPGFSAGPQAIARPLILMVALPLMVGMLVRNRAGKAAARMAPVLNKVSSVSLILLFILLVAGDYRGLLAVIGTGAIAVAILFTGLAFVLGYLLGGRDAQRRGVCGLCAGARNIGAGFVAAGSFKDNKVVIMVVVTAIVSLLLLLAAAAWLRKRGGTPLSTLGANA